MNASNRPLPEWFNRIEAGQIRLPRFQRFEAWTHNEVAGVLEAVLRGLPVGATLTLDVGDSEPFVSRVMEGAPVPVERCNEHLLDGQQRLTALWRSLNDNYPDRTYFVHLPDGADPREDAQPSVMGVPRWMRQDVRYPLWVDDPHGAFSRGLVPVRLLRPGDVYREIMTWCDAATRDDLTASKELQRTILELRDRVRSYNIPYLALPVTTPKDVALEVFIKMNTSAVRLTAFDIVVAQLEEATGQSLHDLVSTLQMRVPDAPAYRDLGNWVLDTAALREDRPPAQASYARLDLSRLESEWDELVEGIAWAVSVLEDERVFDAERLPSTAVLPVLAALHGWLPADPDALGNARALVRAYLWRAFLTARYEQAASTRSFQDFRGLRDAVAGSGTTETIPIFDEDQFPLPSAADLRAARWPKNRDTLGRGVLAVALRAGARDLADDGVVTRQTIRKREYHHVFPNSVLTGVGQLSPAESFRALNCVLITWRTNRRIGAKPPLEYLKDRIEASSLGEQALRDRLASHLVPFAVLADAGWDPAAPPEVVTPTIQKHYEQFLDARAELLLTHVEQLCRGLVPTGS